MVDPHSVVVIDDDPVERRRTASILRSAGLHAREVSGSEAPQAMARGTPPAAVVLDVSLDGITGYEICRRIREMHGERVGVIFVSSVRADPIDRVAGLLLGADDYLPKPFVPDELIARVLRLIWRHDNGGHDVNRHEERHASRPDRLRTPNASNGHQASPDRPYDLTGRELEVLRLLAAGFDQRTVARRLVVSTATISTHIQRILGKLGVHNRAQAVALAHREGLVGELDVDRDSPMRR
jgi:DNA-binding NarL/FixJ family response regulator